MIFLQTFKYNHEIAKWLSPLPGLVSLQIWGDPEKAQKIFEKVPAAHSLLNQTFFSSTLKSGPALDLWAGAGQVTQGVSSDHRQELFEQSFQAQSNAIHNRLRGMARARTCHLMIMCSNHIAE